MGGGGGGGGVYLFYKTVIYILSTSEAWKYES